MWCDFVVLFLILNLNYLKRYSSLFELMTYREKFLELVNIAFINIVFWQALSLMTYAINCLFSDFVNIFNVKGAVENYRTLIVWELTAILFSLISSPIIFVLLFQVCCVLRKMFKFIKAKGPHQTAERQKLQKELYSYRRVSSNPLLL